MEMGIFIIAVSSLWIAVFVRDIFYAEKRQLKVLEKILIELKKDTKTKKMTKKELVAFLKENVYDKENGVMDLMYLNFGDVHVDISHMKTERNIYQDSHEVGGDIYQDSHEVGGDAHQDSHKVRGDVYQYGHEVGGDINQHEHKAEGDINQHEHKAEGDINQEKSEARKNIFQYGHEVGKDIYQDEHKAEGTVFND